MQESFLFINNLWIIQNLLRIITVASLYQYATDKRSQRATLRFIWPLATLITGSSLIKIFEHGSMITIIMLSVINIIFMIISQKTTGTIRLRNLLIALFCSHTALTTTYFYSVKKIHHHIAGKTLSIEGIATNRYQNNGSENIIVAVHRSFDHATNQARTISFNLMVFIPKSPVTIGDTIFIDRYTFSRAQQSADVKPFDHYLMRHGCSTSIYLKHDSPITMIKRPSFSIRRSLYNKRMEIYNLVMEKLTLPAQQLISALFFGIILPETESMKEMFNAWGISHYLARSGLHIALLVSIWSFLLSLLPCHITYRRILLIGIIGFYELLTWSSISFVRALLLFYATMSGYLARRAVNSFYLLNGIACITIIYNPFIPFFIDAQLTFILTGILIMIHQQQSIT